MREIFALRIVKERKRNMMIKKERLYLKGTFP
jgi:hypothetical protein